MRKILLNTLAFITGRPRYFPVLEWSSKSWTHNAFRAFEQTFGRAYEKNGVGDTIRCESSLGMKENPDGTVSIVRTFYTVESVIAHTEGVIRQQLENLGAFVMGRPAPYALYPGYAIAAVTLVVFGAELKLTGQSVFAPIIAGPIAYDTSGERNTGTGNPNTVSFTTSGSNRYLAVAATNQNASNIGTSTYAGVNLVQINDVFYPGITGMKAYALNLVAPASGANTVSIAWGGGTGIRYCISSYTGCAQSGQPDASAKTQQSYAGSISASPTVVASNSWLLSMIQAYNCIFNQPGVSGNVTVTAGVTTIRQDIDDQTAIADSNGTVATGSRTATWTEQTASNLAGCVAWSVAPVAGTTYTPTYTESQTASDDLLAAPARTLTESKTASDDMLAAPARVLTESKTATDTFASAFIQASTLSEAVSAIDSMIRSGIRTLAESVTATATFIKEGARSLLEAITASDTLANILVYGRTLTESVGATDIIRKLVNGSSTIWSGLVKLASSWTGEGKTPSDWTNRDKA